ncbi:hypothetical protein BB560_002980, partial [Smittium megazygosporum]
PMHRIRQEMGVTSINTHASDLRERAYFKYPTLRTWISDLVKQPIRSQTSTWVTGTARWMKRYCQTVGRGNTVKALQHRYTVNDKTKISAWIKAHNMRNTGSWMDLQMRHPDIKLGLQDIGKIRMGCYWTAQRLAKAGLIPKMYIERCPFCNKNTPETIEHMLIECFRWNSIRHETTMFNIPRLYRTVTIDQSTNNQALNQGRNIMSRDRYSPYMKELETGRFMNGIRVVRTLILDRIKCSPTPLNQSIGSINKRDRSNSGDKVVPVYLVKPLTMNYASAVKASPENSEKFSLQPSSVIGFAIVEYKVNPLYSINFGAYFVECQVLWILH